MAVITQDMNVSTGFGAVPINRTTVTSGNNSFTYVPGSGQILYLFNTGASVVTLTMTGTAPISQTVPGYGLVNASAGKAVTVPGSSNVVLELDDFSNYLNGTGAVQAVASATGLNAYLWN